MLARLLRYRADMRYPCLKLSLVSVVSCFLLAFPVIQAQVSSASLQGNITDSSNAAVSHARVTIENGSTGVEMHLMSNEAGVFSAPSIEPGSYRLRIGKEGFAEVAIDNVTLNVGDRKVFQIKLRVSSAHESITVDGSGLTLNTTDASVSTVIDRKFVQNIPLNGRSFQDLISMTPGVVTQSPQSQSSLASNGDFSVNGQRTESNYYTVDGVAGNVSAGTGSGVPQAANSGSIASSTALGTTQSLISVDALQEFRVQSSTYSAEYGRSPGGQFSLVTRSGTNELHGTAYDYLRNNYFDSNDWFNDHYRKAISPLRQNDFGGTLGGSISLPRLYSGKDRSFYFLSYEGLRLSQPQAASLEYVPDKALRTAAPVALRSILNAFPLPSVRGADYPSSGLAEFTEPYSLPAEIDSLSVRLDQRLFSNSFAFVRIGHTSSNAHSRTLSAITKQQLDSDTYTLGLTSQVTNRLSNDFRAEYAVSRSSQKGTLDAFGGAVPTDFSDALGIGGYAGAYPGWELYVPGVGYASLTLTNTRNQGHQINLVDTMSETVASHQLRYGIDYRRIVSSLDPPSPYVFAVYLGNQAVLSNNAYYVDIVKSLAATPVFNQFAAFLQDEWRVFPRFSISVGTRWEVNPPPSEAHGNQAYTLLGNLAQPSSVKLAPRGTALWRTPWYNFAPRLGVAWTVSDHENFETILRAGAGVFFDTDNQVATQGFNAFGFAASQLDYGAALPVTSAQVGFPISSGTPYTNVWAFPSHLQLPYTLQWNVAVEQALGKSQTLSLSYVGSNGRRLLGSQSISFSSFNPSFGSINYLSSGITSNYQALQLKFQRSVTHGIQALASYTWSHAIDYGSTYRALPFERGDSDFDVRSNFQGGLSWELPSFGSRRALRAVLADWAVDGRLIARTAFPVTLYGNYLTDPSTGNQYYSSLDFVPGFPLYLHGSQYPGGRILNRAAFSLPVGSASGNAPRNFLRGFGAEQINFAVRKEFPLHEHARLQFRAETFNLFNHPNFGYIDPYFNDAVFGQATKMLNQSLGTMAPQYQQGGPRSMQFALKATF